MNIRILTGVLAVLLLTVSVYLPGDTAPRAHAQWTVIDPGDIAVNTVTAANTTAQSAGVTPKNFLDALAWTVAKVAIQSVTRSTVNWINSGFQGSPAFVSDLRQNLQYLGDAVADDFLDHLDAEVMTTTGFSVRSPFQDQINRKLRNEFYRTTASYGINQYYTLYRDSKDPKAFIDEGRFSQGGFNAWFSATQNPANNPFGAYLAASNQLWAQVDQAAQARKAELDWGKGFSSWRGNCPQTTPGKVILQKKDTCLFGSVKTPGALIEAPLEQVLGTGIRQLELADSINEIVAALVGQMFNQVLSSSGLSGLSQPAQGGGRSYSDRVGSDQAFDISAAEGVQASLNTDRSNVQTYQDNWQKILAAANTAEQRCGADSTVSSTISTANKEIDRATRAITKIDTVYAEIDRAILATDANKNVAVTTAVADYKAYLNTGLVPNSTEIGYAASNATETDTGDTVSQNPSLLTQMERKAKSCASV